MSYIPNRMATDFTASSSHPRSAATEVHSIGKRSAVALGQLLCFFALLFASGDIWPVFNLGFTFRVAQICVLLALPLAPAAIGSNVRLFPGWQFLCFFVWWITVCLPFSLYLERSLGYLFWTISDVLAIFVFVQFFRTELALRRLIRYFLICFTAVAIFGMVQFALGVIGVDILITQWWIDGVLPRINGLSYEPSYFSTYLVPGWVFSAYLLEKRATTPNRRLLWICVISTTVALVLCSSRMGWLMMLLWLVCRLAALAYRIGVRGKARWRTIFVCLLAPLGLAVMIGLASASWRNLAGVFDTFSFLANGLGIAGGTAHSNEDRTSDLGTTWQAFLNHPVLGTGIGAAPVDIASQHGSIVVTLEDAKDYEGISIFVEILASTGLIGGALLTAFAISVARQCLVKMRSFDRPRSLVLAGLCWSVAWLLLVLQFNQNFLRIYVFLDLAVLMCFLVVPGKNPRSGETANLR
jgi:O-antigen ligase